MQWMIAPRLGNAPISSASTGAWPASTIALTEAPCSVRKSSRPALIGSTRAWYFAVSASASGGGTSPTCRTVVPITNSLRLVGSDHLIVVTAPLAVISCSNNAGTPKMYRRTRGTQTPSSDPVGRRLGGLIALTSSRRNRYSTIEIACRGHCRTASRTCSSFSGVTSSCSTVSVSSSSSRNTSGMMPIHTPLLSHSSQSTSIFLVIQALSPQYLDRYVQPARNILHGDPLATVPIHLVTGHEVEQLLQSDPAFHPGQRRAQA